MLEKKIFMHARHILDEVWSGMIVEGHLVLAKYVNEEAKKEILKKEEIAITSSAISILNWMKQDVDAHYLSSSQNLAFKAQFGVTTLKYFPKDILYNYSCPAIQGVINR